MQKQAKRRSRRSASAAGSRAPDASARSRGQTRLDLGSEEKLSLFGALFNNSSEAILVTDDAGIIQLVNPEFCEITGYAPREIIGEKPGIMRSHRHDDAFYGAMWDTLLADGCWEGQIWNRRKSGEIYPAHLKITSLPAGSMMHMRYVGIFQDLSKFSEAFKNQTHGDPLTGLPNRILLNDRLDFMLAHARRNGQILAVLFIDLDRFKFANDSLGYSAGDAVLQEVARRLKRTVREVDAVFRLGNDEFAVILEEISHIEDAAKVAKKIQTLFARPFAIDGPQHEVYISASIGISLFPYDGVDMDTLVKNAETAMHRAKEQGENSYQHYTPGMNSKALEHLTIEYRLHKALEQHEFLVYYQPQIDIGNNRIVGAEALVRWKHPEIGLVSPGDFIPIAEETGLIIPIGEWVLRTACAQTRCWHEQGYDHLRIAVNLSARQFQQQSIIDTICDTINETSLPPEALELEITESLGMKNAEMTVLTLSELKQRGIRLSIDDFGTGYSSLNYLKRFPVHILKIDQSFVRDISVDQDDEAIVEIVINIAHALKLEVIAEGVENQRQLDFLRDKGCDSVQGYFFSPPVPPDQFLSLLETEKKRLGALADPLSGA